jgi:hypothetical protein
MGISLEVRDETRKHSTVHVARVGHFICGSPYSTVNLAGADGQRRRGCARSGGPDRLPRCGGLFSPPVSPVPTSIATTATTTLDLSLGLNRAITLNVVGAVLSCTNPQAGITYKFEMIQGSGGSKTVATWCSGTNWAGGTTGGGGAPTLSTAAATIDIILCYYDGTYFNCDIEKGFVP